MKKAKAVVKPGACGLNVMLTAELDEQKKLNIDFHSACEPVMSMNDEFKNINWKKGIFSKMLDSYVYKVCSEHLTHPDCPVPSAVMKTIQVLVGAAVEQEVSIKVNKIEEDC
ncbi:MAG: hypothetical protein CVU89_15025 [Firmicutes bacterium HGW-Firmicutes-14]|jgi:hypothetical protein|nr:MAG: hypothetical protein CVU89_15025 [Firmicutes bacterium HGW-Firmicutes-14]